MNMLPNYRVCATTVFTYSNKKCKPSDGSTEVVHIYFRKLPVEVQNIDVLSSLPGDLILLQSTDTGGAQYLERSVSSVIPLKPGCNVMLLYNINNKLRNGSRERFIGLKEAENGKDQRVVVRFPTTGTVSLERRTWLKYDKNGIVQGSRTQFPITPCYAITAHKAQSLTMNAAVVHCAQEFVSGQTYVALLRVKEEAALQVIGFQRKLLLPVPTELLSLVVPNVIQIPVSIIAETTTSTKVFSSVSRTKKGVKMKGMK